MAKRSLGDLAETITLREIQVSQLDHNAERQMSQKRKSENKSEDDCGMRFGRAVASCVGQRNHENLCANQLGDENAPFLPHPSPNTSPAAEN